MSWSDDRLNEAIAQWAQRSYMIVFEETMRNLTGQRVLAPPDKRLHVDTGRLRASVAMNSRFDSVGFEIATNLVYGRAWELGFTIHRHTRIARRVRVSPAYTQRRMYQQPFTVAERTVPARPFLRTALETKKADIEALLMVMLSLVGEELGKVFEMQQAVFHLEM